MAKSVRIVSNDQIPLEKLLPELETALKALICIWLFLVPKTKEQEIRWQIVYSDLPKSIIQLLHPESIKDQMALELREC